MEFRRHGEYHIEVIGDILLIDGRGPFNVETVRQYERSIAEALEQMRTTEAWYQISVLHDMSIFTPDAFKKLEKINRWRMSIGLKATAVVSGHMVGKVLAEQQLANLYLEQGLTHAFFETVEAAKDWIETLHQRA